MSANPEQEKWQLPEPLRLTDDKREVIAERLAAAEAAQARLVARAQSPFARLSPAEFERATAARVVEEYRATLEVLDALILKGERLKRPTRKERGGLRVALEARPAIAAQLAEAYATTGRYDLAAEVTPDRDQKALYLRIWRAIWRDDAHWCACPPPLAGGTHTFVRQDIFSVRHDREMPLLKCSSCPCLNVTPLPAALVEQRALRATARQLAGDLKPDDAKAVLLERGHTSERILK